MRSASQATVISLSKQLQDYVEIQGKNRTWTDFTGFLYRSLLKHQNTLNTKHQRTVAAVIIMTSKFTSASSPGCVRHPGTKPSYLNTDAEQQQQR